MKKLGLALVIVLLVGVVVLGGVGHIVQRSMNPDYAELERLTQSFLEDLKYKDFADAARYHAFADQAKVDIPRLLESCFGVRPEQLNIRDFRVTGVDVDESGKRARTFFRSTGEILNSHSGDGPNEERQIEAILYWQKLAANLGQAPLPTFTPDGPGTPAPTVPAAGPSPTPVVEIDGEKWFMKLESSLH